MTDTFDFLATIYYDLAFELVLLEINGGGKVGKANQNNPTNQT